MTTDPFGQIIGMPEVLKPGAGDGPHPTVLVFEVYLAMLAAAGLCLYLVALAPIVAALAQAGMAVFLAGTIAGGVAAGAVFLPGQPGHGQSPGPAGAARSGHIRLLRRVLHRPDHPRGRCRSGLRVHRGPTPCWRYWGITASAHG